METPSKIMTELSAKLDEPKAVNPCRTCKWAKPERMFFVPQWEFAKCQHPDLMQPDLVTGKKRAASCNLNRDSILVSMSRFLGSPFCGPEGKLWEKR